MELWIRQRTSFILKSNPRQARGFTRRRPRREISLLSTVRVSRPCRQRARATGALQWHQSRSILGSGEELSRSELTRATGGGRDKTCNHHHHHHHTPARRGSSRPRPATSFRHATPSIRRPQRRRPQRLRLGFGIGNLVRRRNQSEYLKFAHFPSSSTD